MKSRHLETFDLLGINSVAKYYVLIPYANDIADEANHGHSKQLERLEPLELLERLEDRKDWNHWNRLPEHWGGLSGNRGAVGKNEHGT